MTSRERVLASLVLAGSAARSSGKTKDRLPIPLGAKMCIASHFY